MSDKAPFSVVVIAKNEEANIEECLASVHGWADEIVVVDDESTDQTPTLSKKYADQVLSRKMRIEGEHRNWAYAQAKNNWILSLDADERVSEELKEEITACLKPDTEFVVFSIPIKTYIGNHWLRYAGWYPANKLRLFRKDRFRYEDAEVHPKALYDGKVRYLKSNIIHKAYRDFEDFFHSVNRQSTLEAQKWIRTNRKMSLLHALWRSLDRFFRRYIRKKGYKDGLYGFVASFFDSVYQILSYVKYREMRRKSKQ